MKANKELDYYRKTHRPEVVQVIRNYVTAPSGPDGKAHLVTLYWSLDGELLAVVDPDDFEE